VSVASEWNIAGRAGDASVGSAHVIRKVVLWQTPILNYVDPLRNELRRARPAC